MPTLPDNQQLPLEQQIQTWNILSSKEGRNVALLNKVVSDGFIDPWRIDAHNAELAFKTSDPDTLKVKEQAMKLAPRNEPVLVTGESGTGKELLATILHGRRHGHFVAVNVCSIVDTLFESELFGHVRGSFTGADKERIGLIKQADGGTLFLDEIGDMPLGLQVKILRVIHNKTYRKVGSNVDEELRCRIVAATHQDLRSMIAAKTFRLDLHERLSVFKLHIKPLRDRMCDCNVLASKEVLTRLGNLHIEVADKHKILSGNVRQLLNLALRCEVLGTDSITVEDII